MSLLGSKSAKKDKAAAAEKPAKPAKPAKTAKAPKPAKAAKAAKTAAAPAAARGVVVEKPKADIYTVMLILALVAIVIGCLALYGEMRMYDMNIKARV